MFKCWWIHFGGDHQKQLQCIQYPLTHSNTQPPTKDEIHLTHSSSQGGSCCVWSICHPVISPGLLPRPHIRQYSRSHNRWWFNIGGVTIGGSLKTTIFCLFAGTSFSGLVVLKNFQQRLWERCVWLPYSIYIYLDVNIQICNILRGLIYIRVSHNTHFFELSYALLTSHANGLEEATKKFSAL